MDPSLQKRFWKVFTQVVFPFVLEEYWRQVFEQRNRKNSWSPLGLFRDLFKLAPNASRSSFNKKGVAVSGEMTFTCVVPKPLFFWDLVLSMYMVARPDVFHSAEFLAATIHGFIQKCGIDPRTFQNFDPGHLKYLDDLRLGKRHLEFFEDPPLAVAKARLILASLPHIRADSDGDPEVIAQMWSDSPEIAKMLDRLGADTQVLVMDIMDHSDSDSDDDKPDPEPEPEKTSEQLEQLASEVPELVV